VLRQFICYASIGSLVFFTGWQPCYAEDSSYLENRVIEISAGAYHTVALKEDGTVWTWGNNESGQLGDGTEIDKGEPVQVKGIEGVKAIAAGGYHTVALKEDGTVWTWGENLYGQLGDDTIDICKNEPVQVKGIEGVKAIAAGERHTVALKEDGTVWSWGNNVFGQLGHTDFVVRNNQPMMVVDLKDVKAIAAGEWHTVALKEDGSIWAWGDNEDGQLGDGRVIATNKPVQAIDIEEVVAIASGNCFTVALKQDGTVWTWGLYFYYDPIENVDIAMTSTQPVCKEGIEDVKAIAAGSDHVVALKEDGTVWTWGRNDYGQLGNGTKVNYNEPVQVTGIEDVKAIAAGTYNSFAIKEDGTVWAWGSNDSGQLGVDEGILYESLVPIQITGIEDVKTIAAGSDHTIAIKEDGTVWGWGSNFAGQLGAIVIADSDTNNEFKYERFMQVRGMEKVKAIAAGYNYTIALKKDGSLWVWGRNNLGNLGEDSIETISIEPVPVKDLEDVIAVSAADDHIVALKKDGTVWSWGLNLYGQLGDGTVMYTSKPVQTKIK